MNLLKIVGLVGYLPIIDIPFYPGGKLAVRGASYRGLSFLCTIVIAVGLLAFFYARSWYVQHPILGKICLIVGIWWGVRQSVRWFRALCDNPLTRVTPYRTLEDLPEKNPGIKNKTNS